jgi:hypothetical protein
MKTPDSFPFITTSDRSGLAPTASLMVAELDEFAGLPVVQKRISTTEITEDTEALEHAFFCQTTFVLLNSLLLNLCVLRALCGRKS